MSGQKELRKVFHLLHGKQFGVATVEAKNFHECEHCEVVLPYYSIFNSFGRYRLNIDPRDRRTLVAFDGALLPNGLPKGSEVLFSEGINISDGLGVPWGQAYKRRETDPTAHFKVLLPQQHGSLGEVRITRFLVLLKSCTAAFVRFDHDRLAPYYVLVRVEKDGPAATVTWISSSRS